MTAPTRGNFTKKQGGGTTGAIATTGGSQSVMLLCVSSATGSTPTVSGTDSAGNTAATWNAGLIVNQNDATSGDRIRIFALVGGVGNASHTVPTDAGGADIVFLVEYTGATGVEVYNAASGTSPFTISTSATTTVADSVIFSMGNADTGTTPVTASCSAATVFSQESDFGTYWGSAIADETVNTTGTKTETWSASPAATRFLRGIVAIKGTASAVFVPATRAAQLIAGAAQSIVPMLRGATVAATALAVTAGVYVPVGAKAAQQAQVAYREASRLPTQMQPTVAATALAVTIGPTVPQGSTSKEQALRAYREPARVVQPPWPPEVLPQSAAQVPPPEFIQAPLQARWPYEQVEAWRTAPEPATFAGITAIYLKAPPVVVQPGVNWAYQAAMPGQGPAAVIPAGQVPFAPLAVPGPQAWVYAALEQWRLAPESAIFAGIQAVYLGPTQPQAAWQGSWSYGAVLSALKPIAAVIPAPDVLLASSVAQIAPAAWPYAATMLAAPSASQFGQGVVPYFGCAPVNQWLTQPPWPYATVATIPVLATESGINPPAPPAFEIIHGPGNGRYRERKRREGGTESYLERLLGRPLDEYEPERVEEVEQAVEREVEQDAKAEPPSQAEVESKFSTYGLEFREAYVRIYLELVALRRQQLEEEFLVALIARML